MTRTAQQVTRTEVIAAIHPAVASVAEPMFSAACHSATIRMLPDPSATQVSTTEPAAMPTKEPRDHEQRKPSHSSVDGKQGDVPHSR
jgi:hypothetical protein